jgi:hypothetical protein
MKSRSKPAFYSLCKLPVLLLFVSAVFGLLAILGLRADAVDITVSWNANSESNIAGYKIYYGMLSGEYSNAVDVSIATEAVFSDLDPYTTYYLAVTAYNNAGLESGYSNEVIFSGTAEEELIISDSPKGAWYLASSTARRRQAQTFRSIGNRIVSVTIPIIRVNNPNIPIAVSIRTSLTGNSLASAVINPSQVTSADYRNPSWVTVVFQSPAAVTAKLQYYLVVEVSGYNLSNYYKVCYDNRNPYADGIYYSENSSTGIPEYDMAGIIKFRKLN